MFFSSSLSFAGSLSIMKALDREEKDVFNLTIVAEDHGTPQLSASQVLSVQVIDVNDEAPVFTRAEFEAQVMENQGPGTTVLKVTATDRDQGWFKCTQTLLFLFLSECQWIIYFHCLFVAMDLMCVWKKVELKLNWRTESVRRGYESKKRWKESKTKCRKTNTIV